MTASALAGGGDGGKDPDSRCVDAVSAASAAPPPGVSSTSAVAEPLLLSRIRAEFQDCVNSSSGEGGGARWICPDDLARYWERLAEDEQRRRGRHRLNAVEKQAIAVRVAQLMQEMDLKHKGRVDMEEWVHYMLLSRTGGASHQVNSLLDKALLQNSTILHDLQRMFEVADTTKTGSLSFQEVVTMYSRKLWHIRPDGNPSKPLSDAELNAGDPEEFAREIIQAMDLNGDSRVTYLEFMAYSLGRRKHEVLLYLYDLSNGAAKQVTPWLMGHQMEGVWHTGCVVYGKEYYYSKDTVYADPGDTSFGKPTRIISLGYTLWRQDELHEFVTRELKPVFQRETYDVVCNNCNHFTDRVTMYLVGKHVPDEVMNQPDFLMKSQSVRVIRPMLNWWLRDRIVVREKGVALPPGIRRLKPGEQLSLGHIVSIHPTQGAGPCILGQICSPEPRAAGGDSSKGEKDKTGSDGWTPSSLLFGTCGVAHRDACGYAGPGAQPAEPENIWVQYFDISFASSGDCRGQVRTESFPPSQLSPVSLGDFDSEAVYQKALRAMVSTSTSSVASPEPRGGRVSRGIAPHRVPVPGSMAEDERAQAQRRGGGLVSQL